MTKPGRFIRYTPIISAPLYEPRSGPTDWEQLTDASKQERAMLEALRQVLPEVRGDDDVIYPRDRDLDTFVRSLAALGYHITPLAQQGDG